MSVKDAVNALKRAEKIVLCYGYNTVEFDKEDALMLEAYGMYKVDQIACPHEGYYEITLAITFVKVTA